jgi:hypothetical protein
VMLRFRGVNITRQPHPYTSYHRFDVAPPLAKDLPMISTGYPRALVRCLEAKYRKHKTNENKPIFIISPAVAEFEIDRGKKMSWNNKGEYYLNTVMMETHIMNQTNLDYPLIHRYFTMNQFNILKSYYDLMNGIDRKIVKDDITKMLIQL